MISYPGCDNFERGVDIFNSETGNAGEHFCKACECPADTFPGKFLLLFANKWTNKK